MKKQLILASLITLAIGTPTAYANNCTVQKGQSVWRIAKEYHLDFSDLLELNKHIKRPHLIHPGDKVALPHGDGSTDTATPSPAHDGESTATADETTASATQARQVLDLVNSERAKAGLRPLALDAKLNEVALEKAKDMAQNGYFAHESQRYGSPFDMLHSFGVEYRSAGENIAAGQPSAQDVMNSWMNSSGHKANILGAGYTKLGVGFVNGGSYGTYWVQEFIGE